MNGVRLRQFAFIAADLDAATEQVHATLGLEVAHRDESMSIFGLRNVVCPLGQDFIEVVSPLGPDTSASRYLQRHGEGGYMVLFQVGDPDAARGAVSRLGVRTIFDYADEHHSTLQLHPKDCGGVMVSLDWTDDDWPAAGPRWRAAVRTDRAHGFSRLHITADDPAQMLDRWAALTGRPHSDGALRLDNAVVKIGQAQNGDRVGVSGLTVKSADVDLAETTQTLLGIPMTFEIEVSTGV
ncbi:VOC family protein [Nocardia pseudovaccinii]|uniref:VOC family protein n=1 Tax=Nocardia pseudovaccinii TaxID=189540 RepID=UPI0007A4E7FD|nr:VOC family protein [Nocardia pseudovaccinii]